ncbi:MAG: drug/metabolite exporter YedA [Methylophilaceae bacterium]|jgi:drug/metabolite transporter (DMT)-like permease|nr:MAG: drug/metabolite exporter YedA [Methylophilaceae bacterium]
MPTKNQTILIVAALFCTHFIWGSTYLAIRFGLESFPPFLMAGGRVLVAGVILYTVLRFLGSKNPTWTEWKGAAIVGLLLPALGNGTVCYVQQTVSSSVAALAIATTPIWMAIFAGAWGHHITRQEWLGIFLGVFGIGLLNIGGSLHGDYISALLLIFAAASWSLGSIWSKHMVMPTGLMSAACQMISGGLFLMIASTYFNESWPSEVSVKSWGAMLYLIVLSSLIAYSAFQYLLKTVRPMVASSNTFVNPIVAFAVGIWFANEQIKQNEYIALAVILIGVALILTSKNIDEIK